MTRATAEEKEEASREKRREKREREKRVVEVQVDENLYRQTRCGRYRMSLLRTQLAARDWLGVEVR